MQAPAAKIAGSTAIVVSVVVFAGSSTCLWAYTKLPRHLRVSTFQYPVLSWLPSATSVEKAGTTAKVAID